MHCAVYPCTFYSVYRSVGPSESGSASTRYGSGSGSFYHQQKSKRNFLVAALKVTDGKIAGSGSGCKSRTVRGTDPAKCHGSTPLIVYIRSIVYVYFLLFLFFFFLKQTKVRTKRIGKEKNFVPSFIASGSVSAYRIASQIYVDPDPYKYNYL